jgi:hypothetical protein
LTEIASHGYLILASGPPPGKPTGGTGQTKLTQMIDSIDWASKGNGAAYGNVDQTKIVAAGQSCGGLEVGCGHKMIEASTLHIILTTTGVLVELPR